MDAFLIALGYWNLFGSLLMLSFLKEEWGNKILVEAARIFHKKYALNFYGKLWLIWLIGLNVCFGWINIKAGYWDFPALKYFLVWADVIIYCLFILLAIWGIRRKHCGVGVYVAIFIFIGWITWAVLSVP